MTARVTALVVAPPGVTDPTPLIDAVERFAPGWTVAPVWAGDPTARPPSGDGWTWECGSGTPTTELEYLGAEPASLPWLIGLRAAHDVLAAGNPVVVLVAGRVAVVGPIGDIDLAARGPDDVVIVPSAIRPIDDPWTPDLSDIEDDGLASASMLSVGAGRLDVVTWLIDQLTRPVPLAVGRLLDLLPPWFGARSAGSDRIVSRWRWDTETPSIVEAPDYSPDAPWTLDPDEDTRGRVSITDRSHAATMDAARPQLEQRPTTLRLPGAIDVDRVIRRLVRRAVRDSEQIPAPFSEPSSFRSWLSENYWLDIHRQRSDVREAFPHPAGRDLERFQAWSASRIVAGEVSFMVPPFEPRVRYRRRARRDDGVDVVGYLRHRSGVGAVGRRFLDCFRTAGLPCTGLGYDRTESPLLDDPPALDEDPEFARTLAFVNGDQFRMVHGDRPDVFDGGSRTIGYWFWELDTLRDSAPVGVDLVDEIWTATTFTAAAFEELGRVPVRTVPFPIPEPIPSGRERDSFDPLADAAERFVFAVVFDHFSVAGRKNPIGAIDAFTRAFAPDEGPLLVIKTLNAASRWNEQERINAAIGDRRDIRLWDTHLSSGDHHAFMSSIDSLVSLHRSEGLGLHLAEAMWLEVPVVATRYSGNLDFMDDECSVLVDADIVPVRDGGIAYPPSARWAEPDLDVAATAMRRLVGDDAERRRIGRAGRQRMSEQASIEDFVVDVSRRLGIT